MLPRGAIRVAWEDLRKTAILGRLGVLAALFADTFPLSTLSTDSWLEKLCAVGGFPSGSKPRNGFQVFWGLGNRRSPAVWIKIFGAWRTAPWEEQHSEAF